MSGLSRTRRAILAHLREHGGATPKQLADALGIDHNTVKQRCWRMAKDGQLDQADGVYTPVTPMTAVTDQAVTGYAGYVGYVGYAPTRNSAPLNGELR